MPPRSSPVRVMLLSFVVLALLRTAVAAQPRPGEESGQVTAEAPPPSTGRQIARGVLFIPRALTYVVLLPVRGAVWAWDRYDVEARWYSTFYNADRSFGIVPQLVYETGFGLMGGGRLVASDVFGDRERLTVAGAYGGTYQARAEAWLDSGVRFDPVVLTVGGNFDRFARLPFYGIGNADGSMRLDTLVDPLVDDTAVQSYYRYQELRAAVAADWRLIDELHVVGRGALTDLSFDSSTRDPSIEMIYDPARLVGFEQDVTHVYGEVEVRWDRRRIERPPWETTAYTTGWLASGFVGGVHGFDQARDFAHYGIDLQGFLHFALGPRMLVLRLRGEGVTGDLDEVPFNELPYLGGDVLRGYDFARFRDRVAAVGTAQYVWDLSRNTNAFLFVDAGRVYRALDDLTFDDLRVGFGGGLELHSSKDFLVAGTLASSRDGGVFVTASLNPLWNEVPRWR